MGSERGRRRGRGRGRGRRRGNLDEVGPGILVLTARYVCSSDPLQRLPPVQRGAPILAAEIFISGKRSRFLYTPVKCFRISTVSVANYCVIR